jgi:molybdate transport system permease protein
MDLTPLVLSAKLALISTAILMVVTAPLTYWLVYYPVRGKFFIESLLSLPLVLPPTVLGFFLLIAMGPHGAIGRFWEDLTGVALVFTFTGIVVAAMAHSLPYAFQPLKTAFERVDKRLLESAYVLGCSRPAAFFRVVLPNTINGLAAAAILAFAHTMGEFGVILMVGGGIPGKTKVASIAIYEYVEALRYREAWLLSLALVAISYLVLLAVNFLNRRSTYEA